MRNRESMCQIRMQAENEKEHAMMSHEMELQNDIVVDEDTEMVVPSAEFGPRRQLPSINNNWYVPWNVKEAFQSCVSI